MPRATAADAANTAARIVLAARHVFAGEGYAAASLDAVADSSGVTRGAVYHHYGSKSGLFRAVVDALQAEVAARIELAADQAPDAGTAVRRGSHAFLDAITEPGIVRVLLVDAPAVLGWEQWRRVDADNSVRSLRDGLGALGTLPDGMLDAMTQLLSGAMNDAALWIAERGRRPEDVDAAHRALDRLLDALV